MSHPNAYKDHTSLPGEPGPTKIEDFEICHPSHFFTSSPTKNGGFFIENWMKADCSENDDGDEEKEEDHSYFKTGWYGASYFRLFG